MNTYHIVSREKSEFFSRGENFKAEYPETALQFFTSKYPNRVFIAVYCLESLSLLGSNYQNSSNIEGQNRASFQSA